MMAEVVAELMEGKRSIEFIVISSASTLSFCRRNTRFLLLFIAVVNAVVGRHKMKVLIAQPRAQGEDGMGVVVRPGPPLIRHFSRRWRRWRQ